MRIDGGRQQVSACTPGCERGRGKSRVVPGERVLIHDTSGRMVFDERCLMN
jgi:hypothetical protein